MNGTSTPPVAPPSAQPTTRHLIRALLLQSAAQFTGAMITAGRTHRKEERPLHTGDVFVLAHLMEKWVYELPTTEEDG